MYVPCDSGAGTASTPSAPPPWIMAEESSLLVGLMKSGDSVKDKENAEAAVALTMLKEMRPPTFQFD